MTNASGSDGRPIAPPPLIENLPHPSDNREVIYDEIEGAPSQSELNEKEGIPADNTPRNNHPSQSNSVSRSSSSPSPSSSVLEQPSRQTMSDQSPPLTELIKYRDSPNTGPESNYIASKEVTPNHLKQFIDINSSTMSDVDIILEGSHFQTIINHNGETITKKIIDWTIRLDAKDWIIIPEEFRGVDLAINGFLSSHRPLKKLSIYRRINGIERFRELCRSIIRSKGYHHTVSIRIVFNRNQIISLSNNDGKIAEICSNDHCQTLLCISCLCLIWTPIKYFCSLEEDFFIFQDLPMKLSKELVAKAIDNVFPVTRENQQIHMHPIL